MNNQKHTVSVTAIMEGSTELVVKVNLSKVALQDDLTTESIVKGVKSKQVEALLDAGKLPNYLQHFEFKKGKKALFKSWKSGLSDRLKRYDSGFSRKKYNLGRFRNIEELKNIVGDYYKIVYVYGVEAISGDSVNGVKHNNRIEKNSKRIAEHRHLILTDNEINYIDSENDITMMIKIKDVKKSQIHVSRSKDNKCNVYYEKEGCIRIQLINNGELVDSEELDLFWVEKTQHNTDKGYKAISLTIGGKSRSIKIHHLYMLLNTNPLVFSCCNWKNASLFNIDHFDGDRLNNKLENLQIITQRKNAGKRGTTEEHIRKSNNNCYDYTLDLIIISEMVMQEIDQYRNRLN